MPEELEEKKEEIKEEVKKDESMEKVENKETEKINSIESKVRPAYFYAFSTFSKE
ncbi:hypothetical protein OFT50_06745 [Brachyspira hyodysenteriae]|nr:hypothetical protein [Brachyspira hyodysenteriae]MDA0071744.1 hypothetical protein [Brachyspira hyodysenteriae]MDA0071776.1 hypothetical protein [Brachyspira hyodysenteriae]